MDRLPPLNAIRAFEAAARHLSITLAAEELSVTPGAVSRQIKGLEDALGLQLLRRGHRQSPQGSSEPPLTLVRRGTISARGQVRKQRSFGLRVQRVLEVLVQQRTQQITVHAKVLLV